MIASCATHKNEKLLSFEYKSTCDTGIKMSKLEIMQSDITLPSKDKKSPKYKFLASVFHRKKKDVVLNKDPVQTDTAENKKTGEKFNDQEEQKKESKTQIERLDKQSSGITQMATKPASKLSGPKNISNKLLQYFQLERDTIRKVLENSENKKEKLRLEISSLQEERNTLVLESEELSRKLDDLRVEHQCLESNFNKSFKEKYVNSLARMDAALREVCDELSDMTEQNKLLIRNGLKGSSENTRKVIKTSQDYLKLQAEKSRYLKQMGKLETRLIIQDVFMHDVVLELYAASEILRKSNVDYSYNGLLKRLEKLREKYIACIQEDPDTDSMVQCTCSDNEAEGGNKTGKASGKDGCKNVQSKANSASAKTQRRIHSDAPAKKDIVEKSRVSTPRQHAVSNVSQAKQQSNSEQKTMKMKKIEEPKDGKGDALNGEKINIPLHVASPIKKSPRRRSTKTTKL